MRSEPPEHDTAALLIDALVADGEPVDAGGFSLDSAAAAAKLDAFQYADRGAYLVPLAEAAVGLDASEVRIVTLGVDVRVTLFGVSLPDPLAPLADPWAQARGQGEDRRGRALGRLGVALHMALGLDGVERIAVRYARDSETLLAEYRAGEPPRLSRLPADAPGELEILVDRPWTERLRLGAPHRAELDHLRAAVRYCRCEFFVDGQLISRQARERELVRRGHGPGYAWSAGLRKAREPSAIDLNVEGVRVETLVSEGEGFLAVVELEAPRRDLSQLRVVHDATVERALAEVEAVRVELLAHAPPPEPATAKLGRGVAKAGGVGFGAVFFVAGIIAGATGFGMLFEGQAWGLFALIFLFSHGGSGAQVIAKVIVDDPGRRKRLTFVLLGAAVVVALVIGWGSGLLP